ncbi:hypothetical protein SCLCIDRAFT_1223951, partial [Scleroderma citrinum Foug A]
MNESNQAIHVLHWIPCPPGHRELDQQQTSIHDWRAQNPPSRQAGGTRGNRICINRQSTTKD